MNACESTGLLSTCIGAVCKHNEYPDLDGHLQALYENNKTLRSCGAINSVLHSLKSACAKHDAHR